MIEFQIELAYVPISYLPPKSTQKIDPKITPYCKTSSCSFSSGVILSTGTDLSAAYATNVIIAPIIKRIGEMIDQIKEGIIKAAFS